MSDSINTVVSDSDLDTTPVTTETPSPKRRGRKPSSEVADRRNTVANLVTESLKSSPGEGFTTSQIVRRLETGGYTTPTVWTDVYCFLLGSSGFTTSGGTGTRVKWSWVPPVTETESEV